MIMNHLNSGAAEMDKVTSNAGDRSPGTAPETVWYDSFCRICGRPQRQATPDDPEKRAICYACYRAVWGEQTVYLPPAPAGTR